MSPQSVAERTRRRVTRRLLPLLVVSYFLAYVDRSNIAIAKFGMQADLGFTDEVIGFGAGIFFAGYLLLEIPGTLIVERWSARKWISRIMITWGLVASLTGFVKTAQEFYWMRFLLGVMEAGFFPGVIVYLTHWFRYEDRARAKALFLISQPIAFVAGLPLSRLILELAGWKWIFILEGLPTVVVGLVLLFYLTDHPSQAKWLPEDEKRWLVEQLEAEKQQKTAIGRADIRQVFREPQVLLLIAVFFLVIAGNQAFGYFLPSITDNMRSMSIQARTIVATAPFACGFFGILLNGRLSSRGHERRWYVAAPILITGLALAGSILAEDNLALVILLLCLAGFCAQAYLPAFWTVPSALLTKSAAAVSVGLINTLGNVGGFVGPAVFGYLRTRTGKFEPGMWFLAGCILAGGVLASGIRTGGSFEKPAGK